jgi:hypothetical protein
MTDTVRDNRIHMQRQLDGIEKLEGTYPFTLKTSVKAYRLNKFLHALVDPDHRRRSLTDREAAFEEAGLTPEERGALPMTCTPGGQRAPLPFSFFWKVQSQNSGMCCVYRTSRHRVQGW